MAMEERRPRGIEQPHRLQLENRRRLTVSGVADVESFDETSIILTTGEGVLVIRGAELHIEKLSLDGGELLVEGEIAALTYEEEDVRRESLLRRLFHG